MEGKFRKIVSFFLFFSLFITSVFGGFPFEFEKVVAAGTIYANSSTGNDTTGDGSSGNPYKTFHKAYTESASGDTIDITGEFNWKDADETGDETYDGYILDKNLTISGHGPSNSIIEASDTQNDTSIDMRVFSIDSGFTVSFVNLSIRYGRLSSTNYTSYEDGPGIKNLGTVIIDGCELYGHTGNSGPSFGGGHGGAINNQGVLTVNSSSIYSNYAYWGGGAIYSYSLTIDPIVVVTNSTIYSNTISMSSSGAPYGAGIAINKGSATITNCTITDNTGNSAGGIYANSSTGSVYLKNSIVVGNTTNSSTYSNLYNRSGNFTSGGYNAVGKSYNFTQATGDWYDSGNLGTFTLNTVGTTGSLNLESAAGRNDDSLGTKTYAITTGSIAANNADGADHNGISVPTTDQRGAGRSGNTDIGSFELNGTGLTVNTPTTQASSIVYNNIQYQQLDVSWTIGDGSRHAAFMKQADSGTASPVNSSQYSASTVFGSGDQIGTSGWYCIYDGVDGTSVTVTGLIASTDYIVQVFEYNGVSAGQMDYMTDIATGNPNSQQTYTPVTRYVNSVEGSDDNDGTEASPWKTFKKTLESAQPGDTIDATGTFTWSDAEETGDTLYDGYTIDKNLTIIGHNPTETIFQASDTENDTSIDSRVFTITSDATVTITGTTVRYGRLSSNSGTSYESGPGILNDGNLTVNYSEIYGNTGNSGPLYGGGYGGGICNNNVLVVDSSSFHDNYAYWGGGGIASTYNSTSAVITNTTIYSNTISMSASGAPYGAGIAHSGGSATIINCTITGNTGNSAGGIYANSSGNTYVKNSIVVGNSTNSSTYSNVYNRSGNLTSAGYNVVGKSYNFNQATGDWYDSDNSGTFTLNTVGTTGTLNLDNSASTNSSPRETTTYAILENSIAIDNANDSAINGVSIPEADQRGAARNGTVDIGAFEYEGLLVVNTPTLQVSNVAVSNIKYNQFDVSWTNGDGYKSLVFVKAGNSGSASPVDGTGYTANSIYGSGSNLDGWYAVYAGTGTSVTVAGLSESTSYIVYVITYNGGGLYSKYLVSSSSENTKNTSTIVLAAPTTQASNINFSSVSSDQMDVSWTNGDGEKRAVFVKRSSSATIEPINNTVYTANTVYQSGTQIGSTGWYCIYNGTGNNVTVTGLSYSANYTVQVFEYNGSSGNEKYLTSESTNNPNTQATTAQVSEETFETGDFSSSLNWEFGGNVDWEVTSDEKYAGTYSAMNGNISDGQSSYMQITLDVLEDGNISFYKKVSSEGNYDKLRFYIDGAQPSSSTWSGSVAWAQHTYAVTAGEHTFKWIYSKDGSVSSGLDTAWVDNIVFPKIYPDSHIVSYSAGDNGSITGEEEQTITEGGNSTSVTAVADAGYSFVRWSDDVTDNPRNDTNVTENIVVSAVFEINSYSLNYSVGSNGSLSGATSQNVNYGGSGSAVRAVPATGYNFTKWSDNVTSNPRTDVNVSGNLSVTAIFSIKTYSLSYTAGTGGSISGNSSQSVDYNSNGSSITAVPTTGYQFSRWSDGSTQNPRTDTNIKNNLSVSAVFTKKQYTLNYGASSGGSINLNAVQNVSYGESGKSVTAVADDGYEFLYWSDGRIDNPRTDTNITSNLSLEAIFGALSEDDFEEEASNDVDDSVGLTVWNKLPVDSVVEEVNQMLDIDETPLKILDNNWNLINMGTLSNFVLTPLPEKLTNLASKFSEINLKLDELDVKQLSDIGKIINFSISISGLTKIIGSNNVVSSLSQKERDRIPEDFVFAQTSKNKIDLDIDVNLDNPSEPKQVLKTISEASMQLVTKPSGEVKKVYGTIYYDSSKVSQGGSGGYLVKPAFASDGKIVLEQFGYKDEDGDGIYTADVNSPSKTGEYEIVTTYEYLDPDIGVKESSLITLVDPKGYIFESISGMQARVSDASVILEKKNKDGDFETWNAEDFSQENPQITDKTGEYSFLVADGFYRIRVESEKYKTFISEEFEVTDGKAVISNIELHPRSVFRKYLGQNLYLILVLLAIIIIFTFVLKKYFLLKGEIYE